MALLSKNGYYLEKQLRIKDNFEEILEKVQRGEKISQQFEAKKDRYSQVQWLLMRYIELCHDHNIKRHQIKRT